MLYQVMNLLHTKCKTLIRSSKSWSLFTCWFHSLHDTKIFSCLVNKTKDKNVKNVCVYFFTSICQMKFPQAVTLKFWFLVEEFSMSGLYTFGNGLYNINPDVLFPQCGEWYPSFSTMLLEQLNSESVTPITLHVCPSPVYVKGNSTSTSSLWGWMVPVSPSTDTCRRLYQ